MRKLAVIGGGGFAKEVREIAALLGDSVVAYFADKEGGSPLPYLGHPDNVVAQKAKFDGVVVGFGAVDRRSLQRRNAMCRWLEEQHIPTPALVSPRSVVGPGASVAEGAYVGHNVVLGPDCRIGRFALLNTCAAVGHDTTVGFCTIMAPFSFVGGDCAIGDTILLGPGARVLQGLKVGDDTVCGMGVSIFQNLPPGTTVWPTLPRVQKRRAPA
jgi:sugar O-acyltransferase (sialic acid O-acetyltransferase NeuD family)